MKVVEVVCFSVRRRVKSIIRTFGMIVASCLGNIMRDERRIEREKVLEYYAGSAREMPRE